MQTPGTGHWQQENIAAALKAVYALDRPASASPSGVYLDGVAINRCDPCVALGAIFAAPGIATLASGQTMVVRRQLQHADASGGPWTDYRDPNDYTITGLNNGAAQGVDLGHGWGIDLAGAKPWVRVRVRPTLSASGTDTIAAGGGILVLGGFDTNPPGDVVT